MSGPAISFPAPDEGLLARWAPVLLTALLLAWPALMNGAALTYSDSMHYLRLGLGAEREYRARPYGWTAGALARTTGSLWPVVAVQALLLAAMIHAALRLARPDLTMRAHLPAGASIALFTTAPWFASYVMPDLLLGAGLLAIFLILGLPSGGRIAMALNAGILALAAGSHPSHPWILLAVLAALLVLRLVAGPSPALSPRRLGIALAAVVLGAGIAVSANRLLTGRAEFIAGGSVFFAARLAHDGLLQRQLAGTCPDPRLPVLCATRGTLAQDADTFLWGSGSLVRPGDDFLALEAEFAVINPEALRAHGWIWARRSLRYALHQFRLLGAGDSLERILVLENAHHLARWVSPAAEARALASRQAREELRDHWSARVAGPVARLALLLCLGIVLLRGLRLWRESPRAAVLLATVLAGLVANAAAIGLGGTVHMRYQARIGWLLPLAALVVLLPGPGALHLGRRGRGGGTEHRA